LLDPVQAVAAFSGISDGTSRSGGSRDLRLPTLLQSRTSAKPLSWRTEIAERNRQIVLIVKSQRLAISQASGYLQTTNVANFHVHKTCTEEQTS